MITTNHLLLGQQTQTLVATFHLLHAEVATVLTLISYSNSFWSNFTDLHKLNLNLSFLNNRLSLIRFYLQNSEA